MTDALSVDVAYRFATGFTVHVARSFPPGLTVLKGPSGAGKTTALHLIAGLLKAQRGHVRLGAETWLDTETSTYVAPERRGAGLVFQSGALFPHLTALENVGFALPSSRRPQAMQWLERLRVGHVAHRKPASFSGGEAQRVAIARVLVRSPRVLLLDEPFAALDDALRDELFADLSALLAANPVPCVLVTHDTLRTSAPVCTMRNGTLAAETTG
ncbi:MAG: ATP-binding cassette domain-containing protein [Archangium sp.]|nr:ATP-binding cassette domain-containing protein [Archangium sp.]